MRYLLSALALTALSSAAAYADPAPQLMSQPQAAHRALFISPMGEPFRAAQSGQHGIDLWFAAADTDHDGKISRAEFIAEAMGFFVALDANKDDTATSAESTSLWQHQSPEVLGLIDMSPPIPDEPTTSEHDSASHHDSAHRGDAYDTAGAGRAGESGIHHTIPVDNRTGPARYGLLNDAEPVMSCDTNFDRRVTREEFQACADRRFTQIDLNGDGFFTPDEADGRGGQSAQH
jgi:hypothetical protein